MKIDKIKQDIHAVLERLGLDCEVSLDEIEKEILQADTAFQSLLILGILGRIMYRADEKAMRLFLPAITEWKNYLPHRELGGLSPDEMMKKYPPGPYEARFIAGLINDYQRRLEINPATGRAEAGSPNESFDVEADFEKFQKEYLHRLPLEQPFSKAGGGFMTIKEIIIEERRQNGRPEKDINKIGIKIFAENTAEGTGWKIAEIEDGYANSLKELEEMRQDLRRRNRTRIRAIRKQFEKEEPYHRCAPEPHQFYCNYAAAVLLDDGSINLVMSLLDRSLAYKPDYKRALEIKRNLQCQKPRKNQS
ncbi:MAG: hypothetical protein A2654_01455 [Candidatus Nealsonbacteria bacterium RIFCSPHIGHO2_01_FULL_43_31]|uniref:Uncharacterized protein n=2 Tax=Candidatus Nealsoniibacteriota TaxID=1817911 RepID=A0A1G2E893_9BACT|nr:MAG: hypothetical protein UV98_C0010G0003 [Parcubacteria group bacterium GW2011_GWB1_43_6]OGZ20477.1 MAG: hypothetical protein A2654_01455 [Candidatus Nealsonbacteria bacterium RIFCSPHIGHO2_01_FULL_43_31]OGZ22094.1 MAG: hypothetical protein A3D46_01970 [Candidatus Nealsonbacteria bacterium RIFCSPHIGHO2_02_FULL_43_13]OGZ25141.1 MAG: hypothetical protein A2922_01445 [Candidatus Nealsonbacteria bacterium RIFCSPLOWO2_01_FULL_43_36]